MSKKTIDQEGKSIDVADGDTAVDSLSPTRRDASSDLRRDTAKPSDDEEGKRKSREAAKARVEAAMASIADGANISITCSTSSLEQQSDETVKESGEENTASAADGDKEDKVKEKKAIESAVDNDDTQNKQDNMSGDQPLAEDDASTSAGIVSDGTANDTEARPKGSDSGGDVDLLLDIWGLEEKDLNNAPLDEHEFGSLVMDCVCKDSIVLAHDKMQKRNAPPKDDGEMEQVKVSNSAIEAEVTCREDVVENVVHTATSTHDLTSKDEVAPEEATNKDVPFDEAEAERLEQEESVAEAAERAEPEVKDDDAKCPEDESPVAEADRQVEPAETETEEVVNKDDNDDENNESPQPSVSFDATYNNLSSCSTDLLGKPSYISNASSVGEVDRLLYQSGNPTNEDEDLRDDNDAGNSNNAKESRTSLPELPPSYTGFLGSLCQCFD